MLRYGVVLLRGSDVRSHEDFAAVSHSLNCGRGALIRSSSCLAAGHNSNGVVKLVGGTVQQLLCLKVTAR